MGYMTGLGNVEELKEPEHGRRIKLRKEAGQRREEGRGEPGRGRVRTGAWVAHHPTLSFST